MAHFADLRRKPSAVQVTLYVGESETLGPGILEIEKELVHIVFPELCDQVVRVGEWCATLVRHD